MNGTTFPKSFSPYTERSAIWSSGSSRELGGVFVTLGIATCLYTAMVRGLFSLKRNRIRAFFLAMAMVSGVVCGVGLFAPAIAKLTWQPSHKYLDDYVFLCDVDWTASSEPNQNKIVGYAIKSQKTLWVTAAFVQGEVKELDICEFDELIRKQGHTIGDTRIAEMALLYCR